MNFFLYFALTVSCLATLAGLLHLVPRLGDGGTRLADLASRAPLLDVIIFMFTTASPVLGIVIGLCSESPVASAFLMCFAGFAGQVVAMLLWIVAHEWAHRKDDTGTRIVVTLNRLVGPWRNNLAVWWTALAVPLFSAIRIVEYLVYPPLTWLIKLPKYRSGDWVNVSRHKFDGLVGYDRIWCLYCDWMTGVWSLGGEMLRNVESFWCPIRFNSPEKCENCKNDFPDVVKAWTPSDGNLKDVVVLLEEKYGGPNDNAWFGHPARLTVEGKEIEDAPVE